MTNKDNKTNNLEKRKEKLGDQLEEMEFRQSGIQKYYNFLEDFENSDIKKRLKEAVILKERTVKLPSKIITDLISIGVTIGKLPKLTQKQMFKTINSHLKKFAQEQNLQLRIVENKNTDESKYTYCFSLKHLI